MPLQVMINATIAEVTLNDSLRYGVQVFLKGKKFSGGRVNAQEMPLAPKLPGLEFHRRLAHGPEASFSMPWRSVTEVKVVSSPSLVVLDNQPALLKVGDEVPVSTQQATGAGEPERADRQLHPVPRHRRDPEGDPARQLPGLVTMDIEQEISSVVVDQTGRRDT